MTIHSPCGYDISRIIELRRGDETLLCYCSASAPTALSADTLQVTGMRQEAPTPHLAAQQGGICPATTTVVRPIAVRSALPAGAVAMCQSSSPQAAGNHARLASNLLAVDITSHNMHEGLNCSLDSSWLGIWWCARPQSLS